MEPYVRKVHYYETDKMGITHHSNYIRWMEEARIHFLESIGLGYDKLEKEGIISPVTHVDCNYKASTTFADEISINVFLEEFKGVRMKVKYEMFNSSGKLVFDAHSEHCFINAAGRPIRLNKDFPEVYEILAAQVKEAD